ncbi:hypothetical protein [Saccharibacillus kuerlensis]|uniref:hypothetical protein n=1 Tax=Saccharibacillus kuerlensis TaxID=459527 RepID=UPI00037E480A|nr:hypothetical protein [Saccharibacillus kuerlensis]
MEKISFAKGDLGNWTVNYRPSNIINPDLARAVPQSGSAAPAPRVGKSGQSGEPAGALERFGEAEQRKLEARRAEKQAEERLAQQKLLQMFYAERAKIEVSPEKLKATAKAMAERSIEQSMITDGISMKVEWRSELHKVSMEISQEAYAKLNEQADSNNKPAVN